MKQPEEELREIFTELDDQMVVDYLIKNPEFLIRNAHVVEAIRVPHPVHSTVPSVEWHTIRARDHIHVLKKNTALLTEQAVTNEGLFYRLLYLQRSLIAVSSLDDMLIYSHRWARDLGLTGVSLHLLSDRWRLGTPSNHTHLTLSRQPFESLRIQHLRQEQHYLRPLSGPELLMALPETKAVGSIAMSMPGNDADLDAVLFTSCDASHYQRGQRAQLLHGIILMLPEFLTR